VRGTIKKLVLDRGFGFIKPTSGADVFFHHSGVADGQRFEDLKEGQTVEFTSTMGPKGPRAEGVQPVTS
jgi:cold shock protein